MQIQLLLMGKTRFPFIREGVDNYFKRLNRYTDFSIRELPELRNTSSWPQPKVLKEEGMHILKALGNRDFVVLLDERGKEMDSIHFAEFLDRKHQEALKSMVFVVGGAYGFSREVYDRGNMQLSLSKMTLKVSGL